MSPNDWDTYVYCPHTSEGDAHGPYVATLRLSEDLETGQGEWFVCCRQCEDNLGNHFMLDFAVEFIVTASLKYSDVAQDLIAAVGKASTK